MAAWYSRPVLFVENVDRSIEFYTRQLGFFEHWRHAENGKTLVAQVDREGCELIFSCQAPRKNGFGRIFISLSVDVLQALRAELEAKAVGIRDGHWGYETMIVEDPDGNELFFPYPARDSDAA